MSVILDALKKLDREKSYHKNGRSNILVDILKPDLSHPVKRVRPYFLIVVLTFVATLAVAYAVMVEFGLLVKLSPPKRVNPVPSNQQTKPLPPESRLRTESSPESVSRRAEAQQVVPAPISREPARIPGKEEQVHPKIEAPAEVKASETKAMIETKPTAEPTQIRVETKNPTETKSTETKSPVETKPVAETKTPASSLDEKKTSMPEKGEAIHGSARKAVETAPTVPTAVPPLLKLSAIVWYADPSMRFAMINGMKATEGSEVEGAKVVEISPTSVRFLQNGRYFDISMTLK